ncbi:GNAT family N-acetyltransferase [Allonocardiopsis opalescens]|uniref:Acetyltransferase (GNAT) family protein n=1 Tax=Allonocardiopsis opalescens TaxID=1144618 RepID=A0A2T0PZN9_9ACTN|nr:GNAT family N-acetyltransferase [Allonocardiopsis opalescens]PRX96986.1 acetyltransferase (GNAT) family protein [Allonocardiopsis opalescens]
METTPAVGFSELAAPAFRHALPALLEIYQSAKRPPAEQLPGRRDILTEHSGHPRFRAVVADVAGEPVGFGYGFHGAPGQWWHDVVGSGITQATGPHEYGRWLGDAWELAELHVRPGWQARGIGRALLDRLSRGLPERTAVLSTPDVESRARRLYRSVGFADVLTGFFFPGSGEPYAVMGARLPLAGSGALSRW